MDHRFFLFSIYISLLIPHLWPLWSASSIFSSIIWLVSILSSACCCRLRLLLPASSSNIRLHSLAFRVTHRAARESWWVDQRLQFFRDTFWTLPSWTKLLPALEDRYLRHDLNISCINYERMIISINIASIKYDDWLVRSTALRATIISEWCLILYIDYNLPLRILWVCLVAHFGIRKNIPNFS